MKNKYFNKENIKNMLIIGIIFIILLSTQYLFPINIMQKTLYLYYVEIILIGIFIISIIDIFIKKKKINIKKKEFIILSLFILWFLILTIYRFIVYRDITGGFIIFRVLTFPILLTFLLRQYKIDKKNIMYALILFVSYTNIYQIHNIMTISNSFRIAKALQNINIYLCFMLALVPFLILILNNNKEKDGKTKYILNTIIGLNLIIITVIALLSGSRIGFLMCPIVLILSYYIINKINIKSLIESSIFGILVFISIFTLIKFDIYDARENLARSVNPILQTFNKEINFNSTEENNSNNNSNIEENENNDNENNEVIIKPPIPEKENPNIEQNNPIIENTLENSTIVDSNNMRNLLWEKSIVFIKANPIFGKSSPDIEIDMYFSNFAVPSKMIQSPHNFILEIWLALGLPGMCIYFVIILSMMLKILVSKINLEIKINFILSMFAIFGFSFFQPLVTSYFVISITLWLIIYLYLKEA